MHMDPTGLFYHGECSAAPNTAYIFKSDGTFGAKLMEWWTSHEMKREAQAWWKGQWDPRPEICFVFVFVVVAGGGGVSLKRGSYFTVIPQTVW